MCSFKDISIKKHSSQEDQLIWLPDRSFPYVIHHVGGDKEAETRNPFVCIWPSVKHVSTPNQEYDELKYVLNREHVCVGRILEKSNSSILFEDIDGHFSRVFGRREHVTVTIAAMTDDEFEVIKRIYENNHWAKLETKEDVVKNFIECLDD